MDLRWRGSKREESLRVRRRDPLGPWGGCSCPMGPSRERGAPPWAAG